MILELVLTVTSVTGAAAAVVIGRRHVEAAETHAADAADTLAETRKLAADLQDLTARVNSSVAWVEWHHVQQVNTHLYQIDWHRAANAREARLAEWQRVLLGRRTPMVLSVEELNEQFEVLAARIGPLNPHADDEPTVEVPAHLAAIRGDESGRHVSEAMPANLAAALEEALVRRGVVVDDLIASGEPNTGEPADDEAKQGPDTTVDEPDTETGYDRQWGPSAGGDDRHDDDAVTLPGGGQPPTAPTKVTALKLGGDIRRLIEEQADARQRELVGAVAARGTLPTPDQPANPHTPPGPPVPTSGPRTVGAAR